MTERPAAPITLSHWALLGGLYMTQYFGTGFFMVALVAILRQSGTSLEKLSVVYLLGLVWALKLLWAPWVDRHGHARFGHFRSWLVAMQTLMIGTLLMIGHFDPVQAFSHVYALCVVLAFASATQAIATDGLACRLARPEDRGTVNGLHAAGGLVGNLLGAGGVLVAYPHVGWAGCTWILAAGTCITLIQLLLFREAPAPRLARVPARLMQRLWVLVLQPGKRGWLAMILFYPLAVSMAYALITPILVDAGWSLDRIGFFVNVIGSLCGIPAAMLTGWLIRHRGRRPVMVGAALLQIPGVLALALPLLGGASAGTVAVAVGLFFFCYNPAVTVISTLMMDHAGQDSPATDFSSQYSLYMLFSILAVTLGTALAGQAGYMTVLASAAACALVMVAVSLRYRHPSAAAETPIDLDAATLLSQAGKQAA
jgi:MFS family permease